MDRFNEKERSLIHNTDATTYTELLSEYKEQPIFREQPLQYMMERVKELWNAVRAYRGWQKAIRTKSPSPKAKQGSYSPPRLSETRPSETRPSEN